MLRGLIPQEYNFFESFDRLPSTRSAQQSCC